MEIPAISSVTTVVAQSQSTSESASASASSKPAAQKAGGTPPAKGGAKPAAAASESSSSNSSTSTAKTYDKRDTDQDGVVSYQEELLYALKHPTEETDDPSAAASTSQKQAGLNAYQQTNTLSQKITSV